MCMVLPPELDTEPGRDSAPDPAMTAALLLQCASRQRRQSRSGLLHRRPVQNVAPSQTSVLETSFRCCFLGLGWGARPPVQGGRITGDEPQRRALLSQVLWGTAGKLGGDATLTVTSVHCRRRAGIRTSLVTVSTWQRRVVVRMQHQGSSAHCLCITLMQGVHERFTVSHL